MTRRGRLGAAALPTEDKAMEIGAQAREQFLSVSEKDLQRQQDPKRQRVNHRALPHPELSGPREIESPRRYALPSAQYGAPRPAPGPLEQCGLAVRGAFYDLLHFSELPAAPEGYGTRLHYVLARQGRAPLLAGCGALLLLLLWVLCLALQ